LERWRLSDVRVFASGITFYAYRYEGLDPAVGGDADNCIGIDVGNYPVTKVILSGLNLSF